MASCPTWHYFFSSLLAWQPRDTSTQPRQTFFLLRDWVLRCLNVAYFQLCFLIQTHYNGNFDVEWDNSERDLHIIAMRLTVNCPTVLQVTLVKCVLLQAFISGLILLAQPVRQFHTATIKCHSPWCHNINSKNCSLKAQLVHESVTIQTRFCVERI